MATKRPAPDDSKMSHQHPPSGSQQHAHKRRRPNHQPALQHATTSGRAFKKAHPVNELKSQIRSLRRLLARAHDALPADVRVEKERALRAAEHGLAAAETAQRRSAVIARWHKVRFFERQKASKRLKKARKLLAAAPPADRAALQRGVQDAEAEVNYALYYPLEKDYVPLFPNRKKDGGEQKGAEESYALDERQGDAEMWQLVKKCMAEGTLENLRKGKLGSNEALDEETVESTKKVSRQAGRSSNTRQSTHKTDDEEKQESEESDNESGGGFFE